MVQTLKRSYLYTAATFALLFTATLTIILLNTLLNLAGMLPHYVSSDGSVETFALAPEPQQVEQTVILFVITVVLVGVLFGGGHYWLIRRDARSDPGADGGAVRHLFLNALLALSALIGVSAGLSTLADIDTTSGEHDTALSLSFALVSAVVFLYIYLERRRVEPAGRAAPIIRQIQEDGVQAVLLVIASVILLLGITSLFHALFVNTGVVEPPQCYSYQFGGPVTTPCLPPPVLSPILTSLFAIAAWGLYVWLGAWSRGAVLKRIVWYAALAYGLVWLLYALAQAFYTALAPLFGNANAWQEALDGSLLFVGAFMTGALITACYAVWLLRLAARMPRLQEAAPQGMLAITAALGAAFFLTGLILLLGGLVELVVPDGRVPDADGWAAAVGTLVTGLVYPVFWLLLFRPRSNPALGGPTIPRRVYVLVLLAGTAIGALVAAVFLVYQIVAYALALPSDPQAARLSGVILLVLGAMALYHLWQLRADVRVIHARAAAGQATPAPAMAAPPEAATIPTPVPEENLEAILQQVYAGALDPSSAAARIRGLAKL